MAQERNPPTREAANPAAPSANADETRALGSPPATAPEVPNPKKKIDPWRFGAITVPPGMQAALLAKPLPELPRDRVYRSPTPSAEPNDAAPDSSEEELRIPRRDLRGPVAAVVALLFVAVVVGWLLRRSSGAPTATTTAAPSQRREEPPKIVPTASTAAPLATASDNAPPVTSVERAQPSRNIRQSPPEKALPPRTANAIPHSFPATPPGASAHPLKGIRADD